MFSREKLAQLQDRMRARHGASGVKPGNVVKIWTGRLVVYDNGNRKEFRAAVKAHSLAGALKIVSQAGFPISLNVMKTYWTRQESDSEWWKVFDSGRVLYLTEIKKYP